MHPSTPPVDAAAPAPNPVDAPSIDQLVRLTELIATAVADAGRGTVVAYRPSSDGVDVIFLGDTDVPGGPAETLLCLDAPPEWDAVGVFSLATARDLDHSNPRRVLLGHVQLRDGRWIMVMGPLEGPWDTSVGATGPEAGEQPVGRVPDAARRVFGLPTAPAAVSPLAYWAALWLRELTAADEPATTWDDAAARFPLLGAAADPVELVDQGRVLGHEVPWSMLRRVVRRGRAPLPGVTAEMAAWMDDGMFARWVCDEVGPPAALAALVDDELPTSLARRVRWVLRAWGLDSWYPWFSGEAGVDDDSCN